MILHGLLLLLLRLDVGLELDLLRKGRPEPVRSGVLLLRLLCHLNLLQLQLLQVLLRLLVLVTRLLLLLVEDAYRLSVVHDDHSGNKEANELAMNLRAKQGHVNTYCFPIDVTI